MLTWYAIEPTYRCGRGDWGYPTSAQILKLNGCRKPTLPSKPILILLLPSHLLDSQERRIQHSCQIDLNDRQIWFLELRRLRIVLDRFAFSNAYPIVSASHQPDQCSSFHTSDGIHIIQPAKSIDRFLKSSKLRVPVRGIDLDGEGSVAELIGHFLRAFEVHVGDADFDAVDGVSWWSLASGRGR